MIPGLAIGAMFALDRIDAERLPPPDTSLPVPDCRPSLGLVRVDPASVVSKMVDRLTGSRGYSHVYVDPCRTIDGKRMVIDYTPLRGVHWAPVNVYANRQVDFVKLDDQQAMEVWGCVRSRIGRPFKVAPMVLAAPSVANCVGLVVSCMPGDIRRELDKLREGPCVSPNTLARYFLGGAT